MKKKDVKILLEKFFVPFFMAMFREALRRDKPFVKLTEKLNEQKSNH